MRCGCPQEWQAATPRTPAIAAIRRRRLVRRNSRVMSIVPCTSSRVIFVANVCASVEVKCESQQQHCSGDPASVHCPECEVHLCAKCDAAMHKVGKLKGHARNAVGPVAAPLIMCDEEDGRVAAVHCAACGMNLCVKCDTDKHKVKARLGHARTAPVPAVVDGDPSVAVVVSSQPPAAVGAYLPSEAARKSLAVDGPYAKYGPCCWFLMRVTSEYRSVSVHRASTDRFFLWLVSVVRVNAAAGQLVKSPQAPVASRSSAAYVFVI